MAASATNFRDLTISSGDLPEAAAGPFDYDECRWISVRIVQTTDRGVGAVATGSGEPAVDVDLASPSDWTWRLDGLALEAEPRRFVSGHGGFVAGRATAYAAAVVVDRNTVRVVEWSNDVALS